MTNKFFLVNLSIGWNFSLLERHYSLALVHCYWCLLFCTKNTLR